MKIQSPNSRFWLPTETAYVLALVVVGVCTSPAVAASQPRQRWKINAAVILLTLLASMQSLAHAAPYELWIINADGTGLKRFADTPGYTCGSPEWSPDGKFVAYDTWREGEKFQDSQIAIIHADGTNIKLIGKGAMPSWSPDGTQIVAHTYDRPQTCVVMHADGSGREVILNHWGSPRWCPRGNRIASLPDNNLAIFDLATGQERIIVPRSVGVHLGFGISRDGTQFCFAGEKNGLYLATLDENSLTANVRCLVATGAYQFPSFSPDGKRIVFGDIPDKSVSQLFTMDLNETNKPQPLTGQDTAKDNWGPTWSPDGKTIIFCTKPVKQLTTDN
jgi:TolB protein